MPSCQNILVTGGAGYIGSVLIPMLLKLDKHVTLLDTFQTTSEERFVSLSNSCLTGSLKIIKGDVQDDETVRESLKDTEGVIYLAGISDGRAGRLNPKLTEEVNFNAFQNFIEQAKMSGCRRFVFASTFGVYGSSYVEPLTENLVPDPQEPYSSSKLRAEQILLNIPNAQLITVSLRLAMVYGYSPNMRLDFIVNRLIDDAFSKEEIKILGGTQVRPQIHIRDAARYLVSLLHLPAANIAGQVFNACGFNKSLLEIAGEIKDFVGNSVSINCLPGRTNETSFLLNQDKLTQATGLVPEINLTQAMEEIQAHLITQSVEDH
ncbi:MAG: NAD-dependent epimerase/dehydratase family protein [Rhodothermales bacterium]